MQSYPLAKVCPGRFSKTPLIVLLGLICLSACQPEARISRNSNSLTGQIPELTLHIEQGELDPSTASPIRLYNKFDESQQFAVKVTPPSQNTSQTIAFPEPLPAGTYRLIIDLTKQNGFARLFPERKTLTYDFTVHARLSDRCYNFDDPKYDVMGWKSTPVYLGDKESPASGASCPGLFYVGTGWPTPLAQTANSTLNGGSLFIPVSSECFPKNRNQLSQEPDWTFTVLSPDLSSLSQWQNLRAISFRVAGKEMAFRISPEFHFTIGGKKSSSYEQHPHPAEYKIMSNNWYVIEHALNLPEQAVLTDIELHISGIPEQTVDEGVNSIFIDGICPEH